MESLKNNKLLLALIGITIFNIAAFLLGEVMVDRTTNRVLQKLMKEYSPSPYGPGFDPDKVKPEVFNSEKKVSAVRQEVEIEQSQQPIMKAILYTDGRRNDWELSRGANPKQ
jgi:hypothetical protein